MFIMCLLFLLFGFLRHCCNTTKSSVKLNLTIQNITNPYKLNMVHQEIENLKESYDSRMEMVKTFYII